MLQNVHFWGVGGHPRDGWATRNDEPFWFSPHLAKWGIRVHDGTGPGEMNRASETSACAQRQSHHQRKMLEKVDVSGISTWTISDDESSQEACVKEAERQATKNRAEHRWSLTRWIFRANQSREGTWGRIKESGEAIIPSAASDVCRRNNQVLIP